MSTDTFLAAVLGLTLSFGTGGSIAAAPKEDPLFNPAPAADDLILPIPGGLEMAFRRITVPGSDFWYYPEREIKLGDAGGGTNDPFSSERRVRVMGVFQDAGSGEWWYPIGKYEVSKAQFAAVMGDGDFNAGLARLVELSGDKDDATIAALSGRERELKLAEPVRWIPWSAVQEFIHRYNMWLFNNPGRTQTLPQLIWEGGGSTTNRMPGYLRLPSEIEWEYAARGGSGALRDGLFERLLPFEQREYDAHAWLSENARGRVRPIGARAPVFGLHDMLGNVSELVGDEFQPELELGKVGGLCVRGGSVQTSARRLGLGLRAEQPIYQEDLQHPGRMIEARSPFTGFRLVIGALVYPDNHYRQALVESFQEYAANFRTNTEVASSGAASAIVQSSAPIAELREQVNQLRARDIDLSTQAEEMIAKLQQIEQLQDREIRKVIFELMENTILIAAEFGRNHYRWQQRLQVALPAAERLSKVSTQYQADYQELLVNTQQYERLVDGNFERYSYFVSRIAEYGPRYTDEALQRTQERQLAPIERDALQLLTGHIESTMRGKREPLVWRQELVQELAQENKVFQ